MTILELDLTDEQTLALAQLVKRFGFDDAERLSVDKAEAETMINAIVELQRALDRVGVSPE